MIFLWLDLVFVLGSPKSLIIVQDAKTLRLAQTYSRQQCSTFAVQVRLLPRPVAHPSPRTKSPAYLEYPRFIAVLVDMSDN